MADSTIKDKQCLNERDWESFNFFIHLSKFIIWNVLSAIFDIAAQLTGKCSLLLRRLSIYFLTSDTTEKSAEQSLENRLDSTIDQKYVSEEPEELIESNKINADIKNASLNTEVHSVTDQNNINEEQMETIKVDDDTVNISFNTNQNNIYGEQMETIKMYDDAVNISLNTYQNNIYEEQMEPIKVYDDTLNVSLNTDQNNIYEEQMEPMQVYNDTVNISSNTEQNNMYEEQMEPMQIYDDAVNDSLNTDQNNIYEEQMEPMQVYDDTVNISSNTDQNNIYEEQMEPMQAYDDAVNVLLNTDQNNIYGEQMEPMQVYDDAVNVLLNTDQNKIYGEQMEPMQVYDDAVNVLLSTEFDSSLNQNNMNKEQTETNKINSDITNTPLNVETSPTENGKKRGLNALDLITKTLIENKVKKEQFKLKVKHITEKSPNKEKKNDELHLIKEQCTPKKSENIINEIKSLFINQEIDKSYSSKKSFNDSSHASPPDHKNGQGDHKYYENGRSFIRSELQFKMEISCPINSLSPEYSLALFVNQNLCLDDFTNSLSNKFGTTGYLMDQNLKCGDVCEVLSDEEQYAFYIVLRRKSDTQNVISDFEKALNTVLRKMINYKLAKLAIPEIEVPKYINVRDAKKCIMNVFGKSNIEVTVCRKTFPINRSVPTMLNFISMQLWEMRIQADLIIFINLEEMYLENWRDEVVENVNAKYPFKNKLINDITIKPMACGDVLTYKFESNVLVCIFFNHDNPSYFACIEKAFKKIKSHLNGLRSLGIQQNSVNFRYKGHSLNRHLDLFRSSNFDKIFICGQNDRRYNQRIQNEKTINYTIEMNKIESPKFKANTIYKTKKEKRNANSLPKTSVDKSFHKKTPDNNPRAFTKPAAIHNDDEEENWDCL